MYFFLIRRRIFFIPSIAAALLINSIGLTQIHSEPDPHQTQSVLPLEKGHFYLIVGAFQIRKNAFRYMNSVRGNGFEVNVGLNDHKNLNYVYIYKSRDYDQTARVRTSARSTALFSDAWIYYESDPIGNSADFISLDESESLENVPDPSVESVSKTSQSREETKSISGVAIAAETVSIEFERPELEYEPSEKMIKDGIKYVFNAVNSKTYKEVKGLISIVDFERNKLMTDVPSNRLVYVPLPGTSSEKVLFITNMFGYRNEQIELVVNNPIDTITNLVSTEGDTTFINFELKRLKAGEIMTMYQVYFYSDAAVMKPESKFQLYQLLDMLQEDDRVKIKLHGHTNSNASGEIIYLDPSNNFFAVTPACERKNGSAKTLSAARCETIRKWLVSKGIDEKRIEIKGWGGKKMIYDKFSAASKKNIRVEVEIIESSET